MHEFRLTNSVGTELFFRYALADQIDAVVCLVHGIGEHSGRYAHVMKFFNSRSLAVIAMDQQGHGKSAGKRGHSGGLETMLDDVALLLEKARELAPGKPLFLYGHSMGGNLVLNYLLKRQPEIAGAVATGPWIRLPKPPSRLLIGLAKFIRPFWPAMTQPNRLDLSGLSSDPKVIADLRQDPLAHDRISVKMGLDLIKGSKDIDNFSGKVRCPVLLMHGADDPITSPSGTERFAGRAKGDVTMRSWDGLRHEIHNEPEKEAVLGFAADWMTLHVR